MKEVIEALQRARSLLVVQESIEESTLVVNAKRDIEIAIKKLEEMH